MKRALMLLALALTVGCTSSQTVTTVEAVVAASEAVINILPNISAAVKTEVTGYLSQASDGVTCVNKELETTDAGVLRALKIAACFSSLSYATLSPGAQGYVSAVNAAIQALLAFYPASGANTATVSASQHTSLAALQVRNLAVGVAARRRPGVTR